MESVTPVLVHASRYPARVRSAYLASFRTRRMNHQFHYDTEKQAQQWLSIHEAFSPARRDEDCINTYQTAFSAASKIVSNRPLIVLSLGCGGGQKDLALLRELRNPEGIQYFPTDVSLPLALTAHTLITNENSFIKSQPAVLDISQTERLNELLPLNAPRLITFFGMLPNFEPEEVLPQLSQVIRADDYLLVSANLAPGADYASGVEKVLPQYDNAQTRRWVATVLLDAGLELDASEIEFVIADNGLLKRIEAAYRFTKSQTIRIDEVKFTFEPGERFQLFFSYRHTPKLLRDLFAPYKLEVVQEWITDSGEEGVFLLRKRQP